MLRPALAASLPLLLPGVARAADVTTLSNTAYWRTYTTQSNEGTPLCGAVTRLDNGGSFYIKWFKGQRYLTVQIFKRGWAIPPGVEAPLRLRFPDTEPWTVNSSKTERTASFLEFYIQADKVRSFAHDFTSAPTMRLEFGAGNEQPWTMNLQGSTPAMSSLVRCIETVAGPDGDNQPFAAAQTTQPSTQPFSGGPPSQPFSSQPFSSQPFSSQPPSQPFPSQPQQRPSQPFPQGDGPANNGPKRLEPEPGDINN